MAIPTNLTPATAIGIDTLPAAISQVLTDAGVHYTVWYTRTPVVDEVLSVWGYGVINGNHQSVLTVWTLNGVGTPVAYLDLNALNVANTPIIVPAFAGVPLYFKVEPVVFGAPVDFTLTLSVIKAAPYTAVEGEVIFVNDDTVPWPAIVLGANDGALRGYVPTVSGESGDVLASGRMLLDDRFTNVGSFNLYEADFSLLQTIPAIATGECEIRSNPARTRFHIGNAALNLSLNPTGGVAKVSTISNDGVLGAVQSLPGAGLLAIAPNVAETILYLAGNNGSANNIVQRWDLVNGVMLGAFAAITGGAFPNNNKITDMLVTTDDELLVVWHQFSPNLVFVHRYSAAGAILATYGFNTNPGGPTLTVSRLAYAWDDPNSFWLWEHDDVTEQSNFRNVKISDGSQLRHVVIDDYSGGYYRPDENADPDRFGPSTSCPFLILQIQEVGVPGCPPTSMEPRVFAGRSGCPTSNMNTGALG